MDKCFLLACILIAGVGGALGWVSRGSDNRIEIPPPTVAELEADVAHLKEVIRQNTDLYRRLLGTIDDSECVDSDLGWELMRFRERILELQPELREAEVRLAKVQYEDSLYHNIEELLSERRSE